jgi:hypothetical protein
MSFNNIVSVSPVIPDPLLVDVIQSKTDNTRKISLSVDEQGDPLLGIANGPCAITLFNRDAVINGSNFEFNVSIATVQKVEDIIQAKLDDLLTEGGDIALPDPLYVNTIVNKVDTNIENQIITTLNTNLQISGDRFLEINNDIDTVKNNIIINLVRYTDTNEIAGLNFITYGSSRQGEGTSQGVFRLYNDDVQFNTRTRSVVADSLIRSIDLEYHSASLNAIF